MATKCLLFFLTAASMVPAASFDPNNPTGANGLILIDKLGRHVRFLDPNSFKEISNLEVGVAPHDLAISPDHKFAYIPVYGDGIYGRNPNPGHTIAIVDLAARQVAATIDIAPYQAPHGVQVDQAGMVYVACDLSRKLLVIDPQTRTVKAAIDTEGTGHWIAVLPDGSKAYVANKNDRLFVSVIDLKAQKIVARVAAPNGIQGIVASPDGKRVLAMDLTQPEVLVIDTSKDAVIDKITLTGNTKGGYKPRYSLDGSIIITCSDNGSFVNIISASDLHGQQKVFTVGKDPMGFAFAPDGKTMLVANHGDGTVSVVDLKAAKVVSTFMGGTGIETLTYY